ncbi:MAG: hypothetical protein ABIG44_02295 [Planctomycetota bacterium]
MICERAQKLLQDEHDQVLTPAQQAVLAAHWQACPACQAYRRQLHALTNALDMLRVETDAEVTRATAVRPSNRLRITGLLAASAAAIILLLVGTWHTRPLPPTVVPGPADPQVSPEPQIDTATPVTISLRGRSADELLAVQVHSSQPNVHVFQLCSVYPCRTE